MHGRSRRMSPGVATQRPRLRGCATVLEQWHARACRGAEFCERGGFFLDGCSPQGCNSGRRGSTGEELLRRGISPLRPRDGPAVSKGAEHGATNDGTVQPSKERSGYRAASVPHCGAIRSADSGMGTDGGTGRRESAGGGAHSAKCRGRPAARAATSSERSRDARRSASAGRSCCRLDPENPA